MRVESSAARGALALSIAGILSKVISLAYTPLLLSILGRGGYGVYSRVLEVFLFIYAITSVGAQPAVAKVVSELNAVGKKRGAIKALEVSKKFYLIFGIFAGLIMMILAFPIAKLIKTSNVALGIMALGPCVAITAVLSAYRGFMQGSNNMKAIAISQILEQFINVIVSLLCAFVLMNFSLSHGVAGAQIGTSVGALIAIFYIIYCFNKDNYEENALEEDISYKISSKKLRKKIIIYSIPIIMSAGLQNLGGLIDSWNVSIRLQYIGFSEGVADALYGNYGLYKTLIGVPMIVITAISTTILPVISSARALKDRKSILSKIRYGYRTTLSIAIPSAIGLAMVSKEIYYVLFNDTEGSKIMLVGSFILILMAITQVQTSILQGINKFYYILFSYGIGILLKILINYFAVAIPSINIYGVLIGNSAWYLVPAIMNHMKIKNTLKMKIPMIKILFKPLLSSGIMALTIWIAYKPINKIYEYLEPSRWVCLPILITLIGVGGFIYLYIMIVIGGFRKSDIESISSKLIRIMPRFMRRKLK